jgi:hypothetical protein
MASNEIGRRFARKSRQDLGNIRHKAQQCSADHKEDGIRNMEPARQQGQHHDGQQSSHKNLHQACHPRQILNLKSSRGKLEVEKKASYSLRERSFQSAKAF